MNSSVSKFLVAAMLLSPVGVALAGSTTTTFGVSTTINTNCKIDSAGNMTFTSYDPSQGAQSATSSLTIHCSKSTPFNIGLDAGIGTGATVGTRIMSGSGSNTLNYSLYSDSGHSTVWGNTVGTNTVSATGAGFSSGNAITKTVYGQIPDQPDAVPGSYSDTVTVTVSF